MGDWPNVAGLATLTCDGPFACANLTFPEPAPDEALIIECASASECADATIRCPSDAACNVSCIGERSCARISLRCPEEHLCSVSCGPGEDACANAVFDWSHTAGLGSLECNETAQCDGANFPASARSGSDGDGSGDNGLWWVYALISIVIGLVVFVMVYFFYPKGESQRGDMKPTMTHRMKGIMHQHDMNVVSHSGNMSRSPLPAQVSSMSPAPTSPCRDEGEGERDCDGDGDELEEKSPVTALEETPIPTPSEVQTEQSHAHRSHIRIKSNHSTHSTEEEHTDQLIDDESTNQLIIRNQPSLPPFFCFFLLNE